MKRGFEPHDVEALTDEERQSKKSKGEGGESGTKTQPKAEEKRWTEMPEACVDGWQVAVEEEFGSTAFQSGLINESLLLHKDHPAQKQKHGLIVIGPSASGKTHGLKLVCALLPMLAAWMKHSFVLDGANFRDASKAWAAVKESAIRSGYIGYSNAYNTLLKKPTDLLKTKLVESLMGEGFNIILPDTCSNLSIIREKIRLFKDAGYTINILACVAPKSVCEQRGHSREQSEGKKYSSKNWHKSVEGVQTVINELREAGEEADFFMLNSHKDDCESAAGSEQAQSAAERLITIKGSEKIAIAIKNDGEDVEVELV
jgi:hypothetical protein